MLRLDRLTRRFGGHVAVDDVSFEVGDGQLVGFVGGNGAGKTTTMRMVMGVLQASAGEVRWNDAPVTAIDRREFGYMPEERGLYPKQPVLEQVAYLAQLHGVSAHDARERGTALLDRFGLADRAKDKLEALSLGNQQRVQIVAAVIARPKMLVLDEPFSGLDPGAVDDMVALLREFTSTGTPVLFSSHQLDLVERLCDRIVILSRGRVVADGVADELRRSGPLRHRLVTGNDAGWVRDLGWLDVIDVGGDTAVVQLAAAEDTDRLLTEALRRGSVRELAEIVPSVADIYREVTA
ncbi:ABC transporter ATP-binding protein [Flexivirga endophytica]|uniref:ABC transporter ATP-binding protein n=1 Tax=Flexivirga endophytica TaxID=1849103 RepID=A0A916T5U6_9MICO|nr:ATP-binding cassette domain-containing protein [Flexivirga endophytica]GGB30873.1 ABC transporter ATP-binding protein [Flexivirga endophytica]GHB51795.1 ABC transporter ATP-binding protein [Flexivirga endophytica]